MDRTGERFTTVHRLSAAAIQTRFQEMRGKNIMLRDTLGEGEHPYILLLTKIIINHIIFD
jgi:hypothetical protein